MSLVFGNMNISLLIQGSPNATRACHSALSFAKEIVNSDHQLYRVFFYQEAVLIGNRFIEYPSDELNLQQEWLSFASNNSIELDICVSAAQRRGIQQSEEENSVEDGFQISGLGQLAEAIIESDRLVSFCE